MTEQGDARLKHKRWRQSDITSLRYRLGEGDTLISVSHILERSPESVAAMMERLRLSFRNTSFLKDSM